MLTGAAGIVSIKLSSLLPDTDLQTICTISVSAATILKIFVDLKRGKKDKSGSI